MLGDTAKYIVANYSENTSDLRHLVHDKTWHIHLAKNPASPHDVLRRIIQANDESCLHLIAKNPKADEEILSLLIAIRPSDWYIPRYIALNPNASEDVLLAIDQPGTTIRHPNFPYGVWVRSAWLKLSVRQIP